MTNILKWSMQTWTNSPTYKAWMNKKWSLRDETLEAIELIEFWDKIWKILSSIWLKTWTWFYEMIKILYWSCITEIWKIDKDKVSYINYVSKIDDIIKEAFEKIFIDFIIWEWCDREKNSKTILHIYTQIRHFIKKHL